MPLDEIVIGILTAFGFYVLWRNARWDEAQYERRRASTAPVRSPDNQSANEPWTAKAVRTMGLPQSKTIKDARPAAVHGDGR